MNGSINKCKQIQNVGSSRIYVTDEIYEFIRPKMNECANELMDDYKLYVSWLINLTNFFF